MSPEAEANEPVVRLRGISKELPGALAVESVDLDIMPGEVHVVAGENRAGRSTPEKLLARVKPSSQAEIPGKPVEA